MTFAIQLETTRGKLSDISNTVEPDSDRCSGPVRGLKATVDQHQIAIKWEPPDIKAAFADVYIVHRVDGPEVRTKETHFEDMDLKLARSIPTL